MENDTADFSGIHHVELNSETYINEKPSSVPGKQKQRMVFKRAGSLSALKFVWPPPSPSRRKGAPVPLDNALQSPPC